MWLLQNFGDNDTSIINNNFLKLRDFFENKNIEYKTSKIIPFIREFESNLDIKNINFFYGSTIGVQTALKYGIKNIFISPKEHEVCGALGNMYLNHDMRVMPVNEVEKWVLSKGYEFFFIKPNSDLKSFDGTVMTPSKLNLFFDFARDKTNYIEENVCVSSIKQIESEYRIFIINDRIITASRYRVGRKVSPSLEIPKDVFDFVESVIEIFNPLPAYVVDVAKMENGSCKVVEYNTINCSGLYMCSPELIYNEIERL